MLGRSIAATNEIQKKSNNERSKKLPPELVLGSLFGDKVLLHHAFDLRPIITFLF
tara:strand:- start:136 stop:300 length:165 start_codon:yes stop_codon:yes gene_type:complete